MNKVLLITLFVYSAGVMAMGQLSFNNEFDYEKPKDEVTNFYEIQSSDIFDKKRQRLRLWVSDQQRDFDILRAQIRLAEGWPPLEKDYLYFRAYSNSLDTLKKVYPHIIPYKLRRLKEYVIERRKLLTKGD
jgi:hypothetical protein